MGRKVCSCPGNCKKAALAGALCSEAPMPGRLRKRTMLGRSDGGAPIRSARNGCPMPVRKTTLTSRGRHTRAKTLLGEVPGAIVGFCFEKFHLGKYDCSKLQ